jgi:Tat protein translocase TatB subunit
MFNIGPEKLVLLMAIALVVLGPQKLPDAARTLGRMIAELRRIAVTARGELREALSEPGDALSGAVIELRQSLRAPLNPGADLPSTVSPPTGTQPVTGGSPPTRPLPAPDDPSLN